MTCRRENYGGLRPCTSYIVLHFTAGDGDTARDNCTYFARESVGASAHWFVDEHEALPSVPEPHIAWHCGAAVYVHPHCRNGNSIAVELCSRRVNGQYVFHRRTLENAAVLVRRLMARYDIPLSHVLRHYDVTGKQCPAPLVEAGAWKEFCDMLLRYDTLAEAPAWAKATLEKLVTQGWLTGTGQGLDLSPDMVRMLVILDRAGVLPAAAAGLPGAE